MIRPIDELVLSAFDDVQQTHDRVTIASFLVRGAAATAQDLRNYRKIADDSLEHLRGSGFLLVDTHGWYRRSN